FADWAEAQGLTGDAVLAGLAGASLGRDGAVVVAVERFGGRVVHSVPGARALSGVTPSEDAPDLLVRDLRGTRLASVEMGPEDLPVLTVTAEGDGLSITLECAAGQLDGPAAIRLLSEFAGRVEQPLRHLL
ncbi:pyruvate dehydrogenase, partial [Rhodobacterales bacterium HKCCSP123]|nr:pyruvate dehydrogenase [Rhodobacterales bacterium HKCCSP123]